MKVTAVTAQYEEGIDWICKNRPGKNVYIFVGGTIGNKTEEENKMFVKMLGENFQQGDLISVGFDRFKNPEIITRAYLDNGYE